MTNYDKTVSALVSLISRNEKISIPSLMLETGLGYRQVREAVQRLNSSGTLYFTEGSTELQPAKKYFAADMSKERFDELTRTLPQSSALKLRVIARHDATGFEGYGYRRLTVKTASELCEAGLVRKGDRGLTLAISFYTASRLLEVLDRIPQDELLAAVAHPFAVSLIKSGRDHTTVIGMPVIPSEIGDYIEELLEKHGSGDPVLPIPERSTDEEKLKLEIIKCFIEHAGCSNKSEYELEMKRCLTELENMEETPKILLKCLKAACDSLRDDLTDEEIDEIKKAYLERLAGEDDFPDFDDDDD